jgi:hypothetical protein
MSPGMIKVWSRAKAIVAAAAPIFMLVDSAITDGTITGDEWVKIIAAVIVAAGVYFVPNKGYVNPIDDKRSARFSEGGYMPPYHGDSYPTPKPPPYNQGGSLRPPSAGSSGPLE